MVITFDLPDEAATRRLGERIGRLAAPGDVLLLEGDLGAGKTTLVQGLAKGLEVPARAVSPTFSLLHELPGRLLLRHLDLYRLETTDLEHLGAEEWFEPDAVVAIEWADRLGPYRPADLLHITITHAGEGRSARMEATGPRSRQLIEQLDPGVRRDDANPVEAVK